MKKTLAVGIVLLFIGVAFAPSLYADVKTISEKQELVEISVELFGLKEKKSQNMTLIINDANEIYSYFEDLESRLSKSTLYGEVIDIYNEVIDELGRYSLLDSFSINEIKKIIDKTYYLIKKANLTNNLFEKNEEDFSNALCLISGFTSQTQSYDVFVNLAILLKWLWLFLGQVIPFLPTFLLFTFLYYLTFFTINFLMPPFRILGKIEIGQAYYDLEADRLSSYIPAEGWVNTLGIANLKECNEPKWGQLTIFDRGKIGPGYATGGAYLTGAVGFTGLIVRLFDKKFYLGSALVVDIGPEFPNI